MRSLRTHVHFACRIPAHRITHKRLQIHVPSMAVNDGQHAFVHAGQVIAP
jgi:hypothetical protein